MSAERSSPTIRESANLKIKDLLQPFRVGEDIALFLVNFERTCEKAGFSSDVWPQKLLTLLPCEAADVIARLSKEDAEAYDKVKASLLRKYRLSAEAFRQRFRHAKKSRESHQEFAYQIKANLEEWLKSAEVHGDHDKVVECIAMEQFYSAISEETKLYLQDKLTEVNLEKAAELAEDYETRRNLRKLSKPENGQRKDFRPNKFEGKRFPPRRNFQRDEPGASEPKNGASGELKLKADASKPPANANRTFDARRPVVCFNCKEEGHFAHHCKKSSVYTSMRDSDESMRLLKPYTQEMIVNGKMKRVLRDSGATMDVAHSSCVTPRDFTGECAWIRHVAGAQSACLPIAKVVIQGPFGELHTEAAVSEHLPEHFSYLFSNKSAELLKERGQSFSDEAVCMALTRSQARLLSEETELARSELLLSEETEFARSEELPGKTAAAKPAPAQETGGPIVSAGSAARKGSRKSAEGRVEGLEHGEGSVLAPSSESWHQLAGVDKDTFVAEQSAYLSLKTLQDNVKEGIAKKNISFSVSSDLMYRRYTDARGRVYNQVVVPEKYRRHLLDLAHGNAWAGHLGIKKTKARLAQEYYWPGCWKDVEQFVRSCDTCQRVGKSTDKWRAPMVLVPVISEPFRRLVIDIVGPLPESRSGCRYVLTALCVGTKFPEAIPLKELNSVSVVNALLSIFSRVGFPSEIQSDNGSVFTSNLTTVFLERCGIKLVHSSVHHPQSNPVERMHSVLKRILRALCSEHRRDWEACVPAALFALRSAPHESTGFSPAELVYGRDLRGPLRMLRESWEGHGEDPGVVAYVLELLERLGKTRDLVESNMKAAQVPSKTYYDRSARKRTFSVGDEVMLLRPSKKNKLEVQWEGPAKVVSKLSDTNYEVKVGKSNKVFHSNLMKPYVQRQALVNNLTLNAPAEEISEIPSLADVEKPAAEELLELIDKQPGLDEEQRNDLKGVVQHFEAVFSHKPGKTTLVEHDIELSSDKPIRSKPYRVSPRQKEIMDAEVKRMCELGVAVPCESDYTSPLIVVETSGKDPRPCVDYRRLNAVTVDQTYPIPNLEERVETVSKSRYISTLDLVRGYWQVPLSERASRYAAFICPLGTFRPVMLSFGLKNAPYCFSSLMDKVLYGLADFALPYLDDVAIFSDSWEEHIEHLRIVLGRLREAGLTVRAEKCHLGSAEVSYLGHVVGRGQRLPSELKVAAVVDYRRPRTKSEVRAFLGLAGYYQHYVKDYSNLASALTDSLRKTEPVNVKWDAKKEAAFQKLKQALSEGPVLRAPDFSKGFVVQCDASDRGLGAVLCQPDAENRERPVLYLSRKLSSREEAYSTSEKECLCLVWAIQKLACYISGSRFVVETDHCPLTWLNSVSSKNGRLLRWSMALQHNFVVRYKKGKLPTNADGLSRAF